MVIPRDFHLGALLLTLVASGCTHVPRATQGGRLADMWGAISTKDYIRTRGVGAAPADAKGQTRRRAASRNAALLMARYELLATVRGVKISGGVTIAQLAERDSLIRELANDMVKGGEEVLTEFMADDGAVVTLELRRTTVEHLIHEKSEREKDLEQRVASSIEEIRRLNGALGIALMGRGSKRQWAEVHEKAVKVKRLSDKINRIEVMLDLPEEKKQANHDYNTLQQIIDVSSELAKEEQENCWFPLSACYWGYGRFSGTRR